MLNINNTTVVRITNDVHVVPQNVYRSKVFCWSFIKMLKIWISLNIKNLWINDNVSDYQDSIFLKIYETPRFIQSYTNPKESKFKGCVEYISHIDMYPISKKYKSYFLYMYPSFVSVMYLHLLWSLDSRWLSPRPMSNPTVVIVKS